MPTGLEAINKMAETAKANKPEETATQEQTVTATTTVTPEKTDAPQATVTPELSEEQFLELAKKRGFKKDEIQETEEQKAERLEREEKEFLTYSVNNLGMKPEVFAMAKMISEKSEEDLAFEEFKEQELAVNPKLKEETIRNRFAKLNPLGEYPAFEKDKDDDDYEEAKQKYEEQKAAFEIEKADAMQRVKVIGSNRKGKFVSPIEGARKQFEQYKATEKIYYKMSNEVDNIAKDFGNKFVYETKDGKIDIDFPSDDFKKEFIEQLKNEAYRLQIQNPSGSVDVKALANNILTLQLRESIDGVLKSKYYNQGIAEGKRGFKNPITSPISSGEPIDMDAIKKGEVTNQQSVQKLQSLRSM